MNDQPKAKRGFALMDPDKQREIASRGGRSAQSEGGHGHRFDASKARELGRLGGEKVFRERGSEHYRQMGAKGGRKRAEKLQQAKALEPPSDFPEKSR